MKVGDLICEISTGRYGIVEKIDVDYYGAGQAFKIYKDIPRGKCIRPGMVDGIGPTKDGKRNRVLILFTDSYPEYVEGNNVEVISESR